MEIEPPLEEEDVFSFGRPGKPPHFRASCNTPESIHTRHKEGGKWPTSTCAAHGGLGDPDGGFSFFRKKNIFSFCRGEKRVRSTCRPGGDPPPQLGQFLRLTRKKTLHQWELSKRWKNTQRKKKNQWKTSSKVDKR